MAFDVNEILNPRPVFDRVFGDDYDVRRNPNIGDIRNQAQSIYGEPRQVDSNRLFDLERRANRLSPITPIQNAGSPANPSNPYSIDTRGLMTGVSNLAVGAINRERQRRVLGDPERAAKFEARGEERRGEYNTRIQEGDAGRGTRRLGERAARDLARANRYQGFGQELQELRSTQAGEQERAKKEQEFVETQFSEQTKAENKRLETMQTGTINLIRDIRRDEQAMARIGAQGRNQLAQIEARHKNDLKLEEWKQKNVIDNNKIPPSVLQGLNAAMRRDQSLNQRESHWLGILNDRMKFQQSVRNGFNPMEEIQKIGEERDKISRAIGEMYQQSGAIPEDAMKAFWDLLGKNEEESYEFDFNVFQDN